MNNFQTDDITLQKGVIEMVTVAGEYCLFIDKVENAQSDEVFHFFQKIAPLLYLRGSLLPEIEEPEHLTSGHFVTEEKWEHVFNTLREKFGKDDLYHLVDQNQEIVQASIAENMADIYQDLKDFLLFLDQNTYTSRIASLYQLRHLFQIRWGLSVINALSSIHSLLTPKGNFEEDDQWEF